MVGLQRTVATSSTIQTLRNNPFLTARRTFANPTAASNKEQPNKEQKSSGGATRASPSSSIYPDSKAADRRHPHAPQLFRHFRRRSLGQDSSPSKESKQRVSSDTYILRNVSTDLELKQLYNSLGKAADSHDAVHAAKLCQLIKERKEQISEIRGTISFEPDEKVVFLAIMRALAHHGLLEEVEAVHADMLAFGYDECIDSLNHMLLAAIVSANEEVTRAVLDRIFALPSSSPSVTDRTEQLAKILLNEKHSASISKPGHAAGFTLPVQKTHNWNASTFAHMIDSACQDHNLEFALLLLSSCYRAGLTLPHESLTRLITLCLHCDEFRAAVELADLMEQGGLVYRLSSETVMESRSSLADNLLRSEVRSGQVARRLPPSIWMSILRSCAEGGYFPGVELAWSRAITQGLLSPDDGLLLAILGLAAKEGSAQMARVCLKHIDPTFEKQQTGLTPDESASDSAAQPKQRLSSPSMGMVIQEWHLAPLFEAYCSARDYAGALRTLRGYDQRGFRITDQTTRRLSTSIYPDKASLQLARDALNGSAMDPTAGTHIAIVNAILNAAVWVGDLTQAFEIYRAIPSYHTVASPTSAQARSKSNMLTPNVETFNALLSGCIDVADYETGIDLLKDLNKLQLKPTAVTFERMIVLCSTQRNYDDAFGFIEEAKEKGVAPSRKSYETLVRKCFREKDLRWERVLADMEDHGYRPGPGLSRELQLHPESLDTQRTRFVTY
ncbi:uncharacterized protein MEPE_03249 [Melanopsichium pennsylvanicum]|uniref:Pentatricopeptide repeat-containing protein-mitochondrial domain-containing protein n=2 Tax=Melanopsichium pennsylvanicum TaxID=63383 RepID=A0AAJ5C5A7_9BASI|nr:uncharacterized protein MEPE_03249 [Melanopsichium pennsylvanicum]